MLSLPARTRRADEAPPRWPFFLGCVFEGHPTHVSTRAAAHERGQALWVGAGFDQQVYIAAGQRLAPGARTEQPSLLSQLGLARLDQRFAHDRHDAGPKRFGLRFEAKASTESAPGAGRGQKTSAGERMRRCRGSKASVESGPLAEGGRSAHASPKTVTFVAGWGD